MQCSLGCKIGFSSVRRGNDNEDEAGHVMSRSISPQIIVYSLQTLSVYPSDAVLFTVSLNASNAFSPTHLPAASLLLVVRPLCADRHPSLIQLLLQPNNILQTLRIPDQLLDLLPLLLRQRDPEILARGRRRTVRGRHVEGPRLDAHDLARELRGLGRGAEERGGLGALGVLDLAVVEEADGRAAVQDPVSIMLLFSPSAPATRRLPYTPPHATPGAMSATYLFPRDRVLHEDQVGECGECAEDVEVGELGEVVRGQDQGREVRQRLREGGLDVRDAVAGEEDGAQARREREVAEELDVVVGEVDCILRLPRISATSFALRSHDIPLPPIPTAGMMAENSVGWGERGGNR